MIRCAPNQAATGDINVFLRCEIRARPDLSALFWIIDVNGTTVADGEVIHEYWSSVMVQSDGVVEAMLYMRQVSPQHFRRYTLVAENSVSISTQEVELYQAMPPGE